MRCIVCHSDWEPADGNQGPICDICRDMDEFAADRARMIAAAGDPVYEETEDGDWQLIR